MLIQQARDLTPGTAISLYLSGSQSCEDEFASWAVMYSPWQRDINFLGAHRASERALTKEWLRAKGVKIPRRNYTLEVKLDHIENVLLPEQSMVADALLHSDVQLREAFVEGVTAGNLLADDAGLLERTDERMRSLRQAGKAATAKGSGSDGGDDGDGGGDDGDGGGDDGDKGGSSVESDADDGADAAVEVDCVMRVMDQLVASREGNFSTHVTWTDRAGGGKLTMPKRRLLKMLQSGVGDMYETHSKDRLRRVAAVSARAARLAALEEGGVGVAEGDELRLQSDYAFMFVEGSAEDTVVKVHYGRVNSIVSTSGKRRNVWKPIALLVDGTNLSNLEVQCNWFEERKKKKKKGKGKRKRGGARTYDLRGLNPNLYESGASDFVTAPAILGVVEMKPLPAGGGFTVDVDTHSAFVALAKSRGGL